MFFIVHMPNGLVAPAGRLFGGLVYNLARGERRKTLASIRTAFPKGFEEVQVRRLAEKVWSNLGRNLFEVVHWMGWTRERITAQVSRARGLEHMDKAMASGRGLFVVTGHLGNWELLGGYLGTKHKGSALAQKLYDPRFDELVNRFRQEKLGATSMIKRGVALRGILEALKENRFLLALVDQDTGQDGVFVPFFGKPAWTQSGVARIARKTGAAIIPAFVVRGAGDQYELHMDREIEVPRTSNIEKDVLETVRRYTEAVESYVKAYPDQWMWMHQRWKTRPPGEAS